MAAICPGRICYKTCGRDAGKKVIVLNIEGIYAKILQSDGKEKKSNIRHLFPTKEVIDVKKPKEELVKYIK